MRTRSLTLSGVVLASLCSVGLAYIHPDAPSASHALEQSSTALHAWMHDNFSNSYGSHGMEVTSLDLHDVLHEWQNANADECDVEEKKLAVDAAMADMSTQWVQNGVFLDPTATAMFYDVYFDHQIVNVYLGFLNCVHHSPPVRSGKGKMGRKLRLRG